MDNESGGNEDDKLASVWRGESQEDWISKRLAELIRKFDSRDNEMHNEKSDCQRGLSSNCDSRWIECYEINEEKYLNTILHFNLRPTTRECAWSHLVTWHDGDHTIRSAISKNPTLNANWLCVL